MKKIKNEIKLRLIANNYSEEIARRFVTDILAPENYPIEQLADIRCSVGEAVANCIMHAYEKPSDKNFIYISARLYDNDEFSIEISDNGCGFDTARIGKHGNEMGFIVMDTFMDSVDIKSKIGKGTTVLMRKKMTKESEDTK